jgi:hypothetical protein
MPNVDRVGTARVYCDHCDASGRRSHAFPAPDGWFYIAAVDEYAGATFYVFACGPACRDALWKRGPGPALPGVTAQVGAVIRARLAGTAPVAPRVCIFDEGSCKAADCPIHGWSKTP